MTVDLFFSKIVRHASKRFRRRRELSPMLCVQRRDVLRMTMHRHRALLRSSGRLLAKVGFFVAGLFWLLDFGATAIAQTYTPMTINIVIVETHDRLSPTPNPGIIKQWEYTVTLKTSGQIVELWKETDISHQTHFDRADQRSTRAGVNSGSLVWQLIGKNKLQRSSNGAGGHEQLSIWNIEISENKTCAI